MIAALLMAQAVAAFNLECSGTTKELLSELGSLNVKTVSEKPFSKTYRIDLAAGRWCDGDCIATKPMVEIAETTITLIHTDSSIEGLRADSELVVHRETGAYISRVRFGLTTYWAEGECRRAPFSGFPTRLF